MVDASTPPAGFFRRRRRLIAVVVVVMGLVALTFWRVSHWPVDARFFGTWEADHAHWGENQYLLWLEFQPDGTVTETWDLIGELTVSPRRWFVDDGELVTHDPFGWDTRRSWAGFHHNVELFRAELLKTPVGGRRYRVRIIDDSRLELESIDGSIWRESSKVLRFHRGRTL